MNTGALELNQRLKKLFFNDQQAHQIVNFIQFGELESARLLLRRHRKLLMEDLHNSEKRIDDLDLLIYQIDKRKI